MANRNLTIDMITQEALMVLHQKLNFVTNIITEYDDSFAQSGAKIGNTLRIRNPIQYNTGTGSTMATGTGADTLENSVTLTVSTQRHVPMRFTSQEMTMNIDDFRERHIIPAMDKLSAMIESDALSMISEVPHMVAAGTAVNFADVLSGGVALSNHLAPRDKRCALLDPQAQADMVNELKGLFHDDREVAKQYKDGLMGRSAGFDFFENTLLPSYTSGTEGGGSAYLTNAVTAQQGSHTSPNSMSLIVDTGTKSVTAGSVFTIAGVNDVHPETKVSTGVLKEFTVTAAFTGAGTITITPALIASGPYQNASAAAANNSKLTFSEAAASTAYKQSLLFQKGFACFGTADLVLPPNTESSRQVMDGISMRLVHNYYDAVKDRLYSRLDVLYGYKILRPDLACKIKHT